MLSGTCADMLSERAEAAGSIRFIEFRNIRGKGAKCYLVQEVVDHVHRGWGVFTARAIDVAVESCLVCDAKRSFPDIGELWKRFFSFPSPYEPRDSPSMI